ncbi:uncharacterized protein Tco025E_02249 [Trypanosoma conorhini]|uniref:Uncharacterized protein n=1 Tax=Trypanosoma conorhini TaxID=83891 RepID=A0A422Q6H6_9TRYP|nr:uncharacterized protein Tco025E_02249 [Trypanosoma conorhini]RNF25569.1 hypothetical protein Tco025E_02249 [Trypanosoma conorhini]
MSIDAGQRMGKRGAPQTLRLGVVLLLVLLAALTLTLPGTEAGVGAKVVYRLSVMKGRIVSEERVYCNDTRLGSEVKESRCANGVGRLQRDPLLVDLRAPPGISRSFDPLLLVAVSVSDCVKSCVNGGWCFKGDDEEPSGDGTSAPPVLGLHVGSPCCGEGYVSYVLDVPSRTITQYEGPLPRFSRNSVFDCQVWQINQVPYAIDQGGLIFPVELFFCEVPVSNVVSELDDSTLVGLLQAEISMTESVDGIRFPREALIGISGWIVSEPHSGKTLRDAGLCYFSKDAAGGGMAEEEQLVCRLPNGLRGFLPVLKIVVKVCIESTQIHFVDSAIFVDLNQMVDAEGYLRLNSSGSLSAALEKSNDGAPLPKVVIGVLFLRDLAIYFSRNSDPEMPTFGMPVVKMAASNFNSDGRIPGMNASRKESMACALPKKCGKGEFYFESINRCGISPNCGRFLPYRYNPNTLRCEANIKLILAVAVLGALFILTDVAVLMMRRNVGKLLRSAAEEELAHNLR